MKKLSTKILLKKVIIMVKTAIVIRIINVPTFLDGISRNAVKNKKSNLFIYISWI